MAKTKTIYYLSMYGQMGNQLALLAHLLAFALDYNFTIVHFASAPLLKNLDKKTIKTAPIRFDKRLNNPTVSLFINNLVRLFCLKRNCFFSGCLFLNKEFDVDRDFKAKKSLRFIIITHWLFRYYSGVIAHQQTIRKMLSFDEALSVKAKLFLLSTKNSFPLHTFFGVHVRKGDYATFFQGKFLWDDDVYYSKMKRLADQVKKPVFIVCSNEEINFDNTFGLQIVYTKGTPAEDIYLLSHCDYIVGPVSTFSSWAAFMGDTYLFHLQDKNEDVELSGFKKFYL